MPKAMLPSGLKLHYQQVGRGPDLVMIHGLTGNLAVWHLRIVPLLMNRFRILTYDLRGHGFSDMPPSGYSATAMADDLADLLDILGIEQADLIGHSYGADIALYFALERPERVRQVVALEAALPALVRDRNDVNWPGWGYWAEVLERSGVDVPSERRNDLEFLIRQSLLVPKKWGPLKGLPREAGPFLRLLDTTTVVRDYEEVGELTLENLGRIQTPVHLIYGERSAFLGTLECLRERIPHASWTLLPRTDWGHFGPLEQPERVVDELRGALEIGRSVEGTMPAPSHSTLSPTP